MRNIHLKKKYWKNFMKYIENAEKKNSRVKQIRRKGEQKNT